MSHLASTSQACRTAPTHMSRNYKKRTAEDTWRARSTAKKKRRHQPAAGDRRRWIFSNKLSQMATLWLVFKNQCGFFRIRRQSSVICTDLRAIKMEMKDCVYPIKTVLKDVFERDSHVSDGWVSTHPGARKSVPESRTSLNLKKSSLLPKTG